MFITENFEISCIFKLFFIAIKKTSKSSIFSICFVPKICFLVYFYYFSFIHLFKSKKIRKHSFKYNHKCNFYIDRNKPVKKYRDYLNSKIC